MNRGRRVAEFAREEDFSPAALDDEGVLLLNVEAETGQRPADPFSSPLDLPDGFEEPRPRASLLTLGFVALGLAAAAWAGLALFVLSRRGFALPPVDALPSALATFAMPLIGLAALALLLSRSSVGEARRFGRLTADLRHEAEALDMRLAIVNQQLDTARTTMAEQAKLLEHYGASATTNLEEVARAMADNADRAAQQAGSIERSGLALAHQFGQLIDIMPALEDRAGRMAGTLADGSQVLGEKVENLDNRLQSLVRLIEEARGKTLSATQSLTAQLLQVQDSTRSATEEVHGLSTLASERIGIAIDRARQAVDETGLTLDMKMADLNILVDQARTASEAIGGKSVARFDEAISDIEARLLQLNMMIESQQHLIGNLDGFLVERIDRIDERFAAFEDQGIARNERLGKALAMLSTQAERLDEALREGNGTAESLISRSEALLLALDASVRELDETHPAALERLDERIARTRRLLADATPEIEKLEAISSAILGRSQEAQALLDGQSGQLAEWLEASETAIGGNHQQLEALQLALAAADESARRLADSSGPQLVAALLRVKETADQATERARQALSRVIPEAANEIGARSAEALTEAVNERVTAQLAQVSQIAERAVKAAHGASDRLMRQLITIADTSASIEARIAEAEEASETREKDHFARRSALLIEALNSASIDISKILSGEISDSHWAAYLKGDRGVFTRRAVRLLDAGEAKAISRLYDGDTAFREHVNRYIHDFEAMLRTILSVRDGSALGVTLLSSDMGKLYVALAQGIERLRS